MAELRVTPSCALRRALEGYYDPADDTIHVELQPASFVAPSLTVVHEHAHKDLMFNSVLGWVERALVLALQTRLLERIREAAGWCHNSLVRSTFQLHEGAATYISVLIWSVDSSIHVLLQRYLNNLPSS